VARFGSDRSVITIWVGLTVIECRIFQGLDTLELADEIEMLIRIHDIDRNSVIVDSDGVGGGVADIVRGVNFVANSRALHKQNFSNLKSQCYVKLSELFKEGKISINLTDPSLVDTLTQELLAVKLKDLDKDNKVAVISKDEMKRMLGVSPDLADSVMMRMWFELKNMKASGRYAIMFTGG
jgi:hypothetical protein